MRTSSLEKVLEKFLVVVFLNLLTASFYADPVIASPKKAVGGHTSAAPSLQKRRTLSPAEQQKFLEARMPGVMIGTFRSYASLFFATQDACIGTHDQDVSETSLQSWYPKKELYMPTHAELFDMIARQTGSSFSYEPKSDYWVFHPPPMGLPYKIAKAQGWTEQNRRGYVAYIPSIAPVGMDIYLLGRYSGLTPDKEKLIREYGAKLFSSHIAPHSTVNEMKEVTVDGATALYFSSPAPKPGLLWRQWAFLKDGELYVIVSAYNKEQKEQIERDVDFMVDSFHSCQAR